MKLSDEQEQAINYCIENPNKSVTIFGYAGTGKSTMLTELMRRMSEAGTSFIFTAPTNKAVKVLKDKGVNAMTLFSLLFKAQLPKMSLETAKHYEGLKAEYTKTQDKHILAEINAIFKQYNTLTAVDVFGDGEGRGLTVIIDECSMVGRKLYGEKLEKLGMRIIAVGDPEQLPPVKDEPYFEKADFSLTTVFRTALDNPILALATKTRYSEREWLRLEYLLGNEFADMMDELPVEEIVEQMKEFDQTICYTNRLRKALNIGSREAKGFTSSIPVKGEKLILKKNIIEKEVFVNGEIIEVKSARAIKGGKGKLSIKFTRDGEDYSRTFYGENINADQHWGDLTNPSKKTFKADYGYAITGHASQGSEYDTVLIVLESPVVNRKWFYTALTRAKQTVKILVVDKGV